MNLKMSVSSHLQIIRVSVSRVCGIVERSDLDDSDRQEHQFIYPGTTERIVNEPRAQVNDNDSWCEKGGRFRAPKV